MKFEDFLKGQPFRTENSVYTFRFDQQANSITGMAGKIMYNPYDELYTDGWSLDSFVNLVDLTTEGFKASAVVCGKVVYVEHRFSDLVAYTSEIEVIDEVDEDPETFGEVDNTGDYFADSM